MAQSPCPRCGRTHVNLWSRAVLNAAPLEPRRHLVCPDCGRPTVDHVLFGECCPPAMVLESSSLVHETEVQLRRTGG